MHKYAMIAILSAVIAVGCAARSPIAPDTGQDGLRPVQEARPMYDERYRLWGEWIWCIPETHDRVDVVPRRDSGVHLNVLKWLEEDCGNCLEITGIENNGDSTIDLTVRIRHPKPGHPEFTGFDVKGIVMFNGSYEIPLPKSAYKSPDLFPSYPDPFKVSWRQLGDPEVLNPDGYTARWCPSYNSGGLNPLLKYWPGKYSSGTPTGNLNAYLNFHTTEERHMFSDTGVVSRTYHIYLPPGPLVAGYAVEACWAPPENVPVLDPLEDFPISANQEEPYHWRLVINNDEPITSSPCCPSDPDDPCDTFRVDVLQWAYDDQPWEGVDGMWVWIPEPYPGDSGWYMSVFWGQCPPSYPGSVWTSGIPFSAYPDGTHRGFSVVWRGELDGSRYEVSHTVFDFTVDKE
jgi:hypothetical protein